MNNTFNFVNMSPEGYFLTFFLLSFALILLRPKKSPIRTIDDLIEDESALEASEMEVSKAKDEMELWAERDYILIENYGSGDGFSRDYMLELREKMSQQNLRVEVIEVNRSLVAMETGNFLGFKILAHVDDERSVRKFLVQWFKKS